ncbi:hypothetical protein BURKHO8Y_210480 [Burkholderia sp. 8Y]|nr:hypothetical protein BURKHO8Y_210480 [Burkholderia sp. 8Y]
MAMSMTPGIIEFKSIATRTHQSVLVVLTSTEGHLSIILMHLQRSGFFNARNVSAEAKPVVLLRIREE